tara:strand:- start:734 stop:2401 length:1668 start_codon:yes stop_codon:yes gene_type:complete
MPLKFEGLNRPSVEHGVSDTSYPNRVAITQASKAVNFDMALDGKLESRGGSYYLTTTAAHPAGNMTFIHDYTSRGTDGSVTHTIIAKCFSVLFKYNTSTGVFDSIKTGLSPLNKPSIVNFVSDAGAEVLIYADGENLGMYDGSSWTDISGNFNAITGRDMPRYVFVKHNRLWAAGDDANPDVVYFCPTMSPDTNWGANDWVRIAGGLEKITGISEIYSHLLVSGQNSMHIITGMTPVDFSPIQVSDEAGCSSHWSIVTVGSEVYWASEDGIHIGRLRASEDDALATETISLNMQVTYDRIAAGSHGTIEGVYFSPKKQIYWAVRDGDNGRSEADRLLVLSIARSSINSPKPTFGPDTRFVWAGHHEFADAAHTYGCISVVKTSNEIPELYIGGINGRALIMYSGYKDARDTKASTTGAANVEYEIRSREETFGGTARTARVAYFFPTFYQKHNSSCTVQFIINRTILKPTTSRAITFRGNIPYWNDGTDPQITSKWSSTIWDDKPVLSAKVRVGHQAHSVIFLIKNDGSRTKDEVSWVGYDMDYQSLARVRGRDA